MKSNQIKLVCYLFIITMTTQKDIKSTSIKDICGEAKNTSDHKSIINKENSAAQIGVSNSGTIFKATVNKKHRAVKMMKLDDPTNETFFRNEIDFTRRLKENAGFVNLMETYDCLYTKDKVYLSMESYERDVGSIIYSNIDSDNSPYRQNILWLSFIANTLVNLILNMHLGGFVHGDIELSYLLARNNFDIVLSGFGNLKEIGVPANASSRPFVVEQNKALIKGTVKLRAPETTSDGIYSQESDIYTLGVSIHKLIYGNNINRYNDISEKDIYDYQKKVCSNQNLLDKMIHDKFPVYCKFYIETLLKMISPQRENRPVGGELRSKFREITIDVARYAIGIFQMTSKAEKETNDSFDLSRITPRKERADIRTFLLSALENLKHKLTDQNKKQFVWAQLEPYYIALAESSQKKSGSNLSQVAFMLFENDIKTVQGNNII